MKMVTAFICCIVAVMAISSCDNSDEESISSSPQPTSENSDIQNITKSFVNKLGMSFQYVPSGSFTMGMNPNADTADIPKIFIEQEKPHTVQIDREFYIQTTEVTNEQFQKFVDATGYDGGKQGKKYFLQHLHDPQYTAYRGAKKPTVFVSMHDAIAFCQWLSKEDGRSYRLPTEEEWEYVSKAGGDLAFCNSVGGQLNEYAWFKENAQQHPHQVAQKKINPWNTYDMLGNVWEWTSSSFPEDIAKESGLGKEIKHIRGGSFINSASSCRSAARWAGWPPSERDRAVGFRVLCEAVPASQSK